MGNCFLYKRGGGFGGAIPDIVKVALGKVISLSDSKDAKLKGLRVFGKTTQNGTPSPDAPVPLESVGDGGSVGVTVCGKNLFDIYDKYSYVNCSVQDGIVTVDVSNTNGTGAVWANFYTRKADRLQNNKQYLLVTEILETNGFGNLYMTSAEDGSNTGQFSTESTVMGPSVGKYFSIVRTRETFDACQTMCRGYMRIPAGTHAKIKFRISILEDITVNESNFVYEPYKGQTLTISTPNGLPGIPVSSGGNYTDSNGQQWICDEVDFARGKYVQRVLIERVTRDLGRWSQSSNLISRFNNAIKQKIYTAPICTHFIGKDKVVADLGCVCNNIGNQMCFNTQFTVIEDWFNWLDENEVYTIYALAEDEEHLLSAEEIAAYAALHTNYPNTTIYNDADAYMEVKYTAIGG